jgi:hypothetical protein
MIGAVPRIGGQEIKTADDSFMLALESARQAVECAVANQARPRCLQSQPPVLAENALRAGLANPRVAMSARSRCLMRIDIGIRNDLALLVGKTRRILPAAHLRSHDYHRAGCNASPKQWPSGRTGGRCRRGSGADDADYKETLSRSIFANSVGRWRFTLNTYFSPLSVYGRPNCPHLQPGFLFLVSAFACGTPAPRTPNTGTPIEARETRFYLSFNASEEILASGESR